MFRGWRGVGWSAAFAVLGTVAGAILTPAAALVILPTYQSSVTSNPQAAQIEAAFGTIINQYEALFSNSVTVTIALALSSDVGLGENSTFREDVPYAQFRSALGASSSGPAQTEFATLPSTVPAIFGTSTVEISLPNAGALGCANFTVGCESPPTGQKDSTLTINPAPLAGQAVQFTRVDGQVATNNYDFTGVAEHELDEILGLGSALNGCTDAPSSCVRPEDFFRYDQNSTTRSFTTSSAATAFLSINGGVSDLIQLAQDPDGDYGDFYSPGTTTEDENAPCTAIVQNAFTCNGQVANTSRNSPEIQSLAAMGWDPRFSTAATSTIWQVNCTTGKIASTGFVTTASTSVSGPLGALLGTPTGPGSFSTLPAPGDIVEITGICVEDVTVTTSNLLLTNSEGPDGLAADVDDADGVQGQLEIDAAQRIVITGLSLGDFNASFSFASASDLATLLVHDGATVTLMHTDDSNSPSYGLLARRNAMVTLLDDNFYYNGFDNGASGIGVLTNSKAMIGANDGSLSVLVQGSGGDGVTVSVGSSAILYAASLTQNASRQLSLEGSSSARLSGSAVTLAMAGCDTLHGGACGNAIEATGSSALRIENGASVSALDTSNSSNASSAIVLSLGSALLAQGATIEAPAATAATIQATDNSVVGLAGGNLICASPCTSATTGAVVAIDHVSTLIQLAPAAFGYAAAKDSLFGSGTVQLQSTVELGLGTIGTGGPPSLAWTTGSNGIAVAQNSSLRLQGGTAFTGSISLAQGSNGFFTTANGGTNSVSGSVTCPFTAIAAAHVAGQNLVQPNVVLLANFQSTASPGCLPF